jgi:hypothetical protein
MKDELLVLLGCGLTALLVTNACTPMFKDTTSEDEFSDGYMKRQQRRRRYEMEEGYNGCGGDMRQEGYGGCGGDMRQEGYGGNSQPMVDYYNQPATVPASQDYSPLMFSQLVSSSEPYIESDYIDMKTYTQNPDGIKVYNEKNDTIGLPVTDMTDISPGENNKYVYDRTIGTIGFTSTKIGGRSRGNADYIRGDLAIVPNKNTGWFQTSSDPANKLMVGAINQANGIGDVKPKSTGGAQFAMGGPVTLDSLREQQQASNEVNKPGAQFALGSAIPEVTVADIIKASQAQNDQYADAIGVKTS